jgi:osmotically-inducible protein OsmY
MTKTLPMRHAALAAALGATLLLGACAPLLIGGAAVGTAMVLNDRRSAGAQLEDQTIESRVLSLASQMFGDRARVSATSYNRTVLLTGEVPTEADRKAIEQQVARLENVRATVNEIGVMPVAAMATRSNDTVLTSKVKATFVDVKDLDSTAIKVVTTRGVVYLMGRVTEREANRATELARSVSGVQKVVRVFETVSEEDLARMRVGG